MRNFYAKRAEAKLAAETGGIKFHGVDAEGFELNGFYWRKPGGPFRRLPEATVARPFTDDLNALADFSAGGQLRFRSNTARMVVRVKLSDAHKIVRMSQVGLMGFDVYIGDGLDSRFFGVTAFNFGAMEYGVELYSDDTRELRGFTVNFPLFAEIEALEIGLSDDAVVEAPGPWRDARPIVVYGTSITHGACANRPGMAYPAILGRRLFMPVLNFGFAGNAKGEDFMAGTLAEIANPSFYIIDYDANTTPEKLRETLPVFLDILRKAHPQTPVLLVSCLPFSRDYSTGGISRRNAEHNEVHRCEVEARRRRGDANVYFIEGTSLLGADPMDCSADGIHLNDVGFSRMADGIGAVIQRVLGFGRADAR